MKRNGVKEWIFQRISNIAIVLWSLMYLCMLVNQTDLNYQSWLSMHSAIWFKLVSTVVLFVVVINSLLAGWQIGTDYTKKVPIKGFDKAYYAFYITLTTLYFAFGLTILWF